MCIACVEVSLRKGVTLRLFLTVDRNGFNEGGEKWSGDGRGMDFIQARASA